MGVSTDAILAYGYDLGDSPEFPWLNDDERVDGDAIENRLLSEVAGFTEEWSSESDGYWDRKEEAEERLGVEVVYHCSYDYPMYFIAAAGTAERASRGYPEVIASLDTKPEWDDQLARAMDALGIKPEGPPRWHLFSMWG